MIKLKEILNEIFTEGGLYQWKTPTGTPDEVVEFIHKLFESLHRRGIDTEGMIEISHFPDNPIWMVYKPKMALPTKPNALLAVAFDTKTNQWILKLPGKTENMKMDDKLIEFVIQHWNDL